jgi:hypothetical protein
LAPIMGIAATGFRYPGGIRQFSTVTILFGWLIIFSYGDFITAISEISVKQQFLT